MKILSPLTGSGTGPTGQAGSPGHVDAFLRALADMGYQVTLVSPATAGEQTFNRDWGPLVRSVRRAAWKRAAARGRHPGRTV
jgi:hypothetical protein